MFVGKFSDYVCITGSFHPITMPWIRIMHLVTAQLHGSGVKKRIMLGVMTERGFLVSQEVLERWCFGTSSQYNTQ
jgi:hypothetical protein